MSCSVAASCRAALDEMTRLHPSRSRLSDGICGDARHQRRKSDHNAGEAFDLTHDPSNGVGCGSISEWLRAQVLSGRERRVKYIIFNRRIFNPSISPAWRAYSGSNPHTKHMHVSILNTARNTVSPWWKGAPSSSTTRPVTRPAGHAHATPVLRKGGRGTAVKDAQTHLGATVDGIFGPKTETALKRFQKRHALVVDGVIGPKTWRALHGKK